MPTNARLITDSVARGRELAHRFAPEKPKKMALGAASAGVLIAEGDSWFDYPFWDVLAILEDRYRFDVESVARRGERIEEMAFGSNQLDELRRRVDKVASRNLVPRAYLLSGGGNDIAGEEFAMLLNHADSEIAGLNEDVVRGVIDQRMRLSYATILGFIDELNRMRFKTTLPVLLHGYDYAVPDGRGYLGGWWLLPGPWLEPGFRTKGFGTKTLRERARSAAIIVTLIDRINAMLASLARQPPFKGWVKYVDLRGTLSNKPSDYKKWWDNELHPNERGFRAVAEKIRAAIP